jgi:hypothetical protein
MTREEQSKKRYSSRTNSSNLRAQRVHYDLESLAAFPYYSIFHQTSQML